MNVQTNSSPIEFRSVSKAYGETKSRHVVFEDVSLTINSNEFVAVVGGSGCGKTTLMNMAAGFTKPSSGKVFVNDVEVTGAGRDRGVVFQQYAVFPWLTVRENIAFPLNLGCCKLAEEEKREIVDHYLAVMGLEKFENALPKQLSGGMKQRVAIGRAYAANPKILLMDEPFAALDAQSRVLMQDALQKITTEERKSAMFITHSVEEAIFLADRIVILAGRPARLAEDIRVPFGGERDEDIRLSSEFIELRRHIEHSLKH
ncbi:ABC transporter ATP-binding protein [Vannielia litorea]|uniref:NitT/TauT family transport system ATP-binding protein n=1 Tax=Vannielia litorea TaxID=1217970 RepID=A0A1N6GTV9_9RHOB|nr:ABC transporter ATP-binding protein [Vannielia litorea]SIO10946.1 NitT/TauT family transport system ATP-binding protein [Vannielia litorea]